MELEELVEKLCSMPYSGKPSMLSSWEETDQDEAYAYFVMQNIESIREYLWRYLELSE